MYLEILMLHTCFVSTFLCFVYTLRYFYTFFGNNLLTRCCSASCLFSAVFGFRKASKEIFSELDGTKAKVNILPEGTQSPKGSRRGPRGGHTIGVAWPRGCAPALGVAPSGAHRPCPFAY